MIEQTIWLHRDAPLKPPAGAACNGCGLCCATEPCPAGMLLSLRMRGRCRLLRYDGPARRYHCGLMPRPDTPHRFAWAATLAAWSRRGVRALIGRWIGAGLGCDSSVQAIAARR